MSGQGTKLAVTFAASLVLHTAVLWAVATRIEPRQAKPQGEVEIVDRELFFRHAPARRAERTGPVSDSQRLDAREAQTAVPASAEAEALAPAAAETVAPAAAEAVRQYTPEQRLANINAADIARPVTDAAATLAQQAPERIDPEPEPSVALPVDDEASLAAAPTDDRLSPRAREERARQAHADGRLAAAPSGERLVRAEPGRDAQPVESAESVTAAAPGDRVAPAERDVLRAQAAPPPETTAVAAAEQRLARADASRDAVRIEAVDVVASAPAAPADSGIAVIRQPEAAPRAAVQPRRTVAARPAGGRESPVEPSETAEPVRHAAATATPAAPVVVPVEPEASDEAPVVAERLTPDIPTAEAMVLIGKAVEAAASRTVQPDPPDRAAPAPAVAARTASAKPVDPVTGTPAAPTANTQTARPVAPPNSVDPTTPAVAVPVASDAAAAQERLDSHQRLAALQSAEAVDSGPARRVLPASDAATAQARPRQPERLTALQHSQQVDSGPAETVAPATTDATRLPPASAEPASVDRTVERVAPSVSPPAAVAPSDAAPVRSDAIRPQRIARASPQAAEPTAEPAPQLAPVPAAPETRTPAPSPRQRLAAIDPADRFTQSYKGGECFLALREASAGDAEIVSYGVQLQSVLAFKDAFVQELDIEPRVGWQAITDAQCSGISFARVVLGNSAPSLTIQLDHQEIMSGSALSGRLPDDSSEHLAMLLVDDDGLVHNISQFLRPGPDGVDLFIPQLHAIRDGKRKVHLLMAISASTALPALESDEAIHSDDFFAQLLQQVREADAKIELGLDHFVVF